MATIQQLYDTLNERRRPEDVAEMVIKLIGHQLNSKELSVLEKAAKGSLKRNLFGYTSMLETFAGVKGAEKQISKAIEIFKLQTDDKADYNNFEEIESFIKNVSPSIHKNYGKNDFKADRLNKLQRQEIGLDLSKRNYNKKWRLLKRIEKKLFTVIRENRKLEFQLISKHGLAHHIDYKTFSSDLNAACFIAYYNARCNLRSVFTNQSQERPFDEISNMLLNRCLKEERVNDTSVKWWGIAHIYTSQSVLQKLTAEQKGKLLGRWTSVLQDIANLLDEVWKYSNINRHLW